MTISMTMPSRPAILALALALAGAVGVALAGAPLEQASQEAQSRSDSQARALPPPRRIADRIPVALYEFRSDLPDVPARGSTDMFLTALVRSGQFRVVERARLNEGVAREKQLNASGLTSGQSAQTKLRAPRYILEGAITEASASQLQRSATVGVGGLQIGHGSNHDTIGIDVRVVDAASGEIVDVVSLRKPIHSESASVSGVDSLVGAVLAKRGVDSPYVPSAQVSQDRKGSIDTALRALIDEAVTELATRLGS